MIKFELKSRKKLIFLQVNDCKGTYVISSESPFTTVGPENICLIENELR